MVTNPRYISFDHCDIENMVALFCLQVQEITGKAPFTVYPVPRGGVAVAYMMLAHLPQMKIVSDPELAQYFVDDIIDSGATMERYCDEYPGRGFLALVDKTNPKTAEQFRGKWLLFPWEGETETGPQENVRRLLQFIGEDPERGGLLETPDRYVKALTHWTSGYKKDPATVLKCFQDGADKVDEMVVVVDIPFYSLCEHHMAPFFGTATVGYIPNGKIVGLSKINRLVDIFARRLQVQERLTNDVADALMTHLSPQGVGVVVKARHLCMESRGVCQQGHHTITSALRGKMKEEPQVRAEFLSFS